MANSRTSISINEEVWKDFLDVLYHKNGKTHGGVISRTLEELIREYVKEEKKVQPLSS